MILFCRPVEGRKREKMESHSWFSEAEQQFSRTSQPRGQTTPVRAIVMDETTWYLVILLDIVTTLYILRCS